MNGIWGGMLLVGIIYGVMTGRTEAVSAAVLDSSRDAVTLCITMLGITGLWMGLMQIAQDGGAVSVISAKMKPLIRFLFPGIPENHPASGAITLNFAANFLGLGWAATPAGLQAMKELEALRELRFEPEYYHDFKKRNELDQQIDDVHVEIDRLMQKWEEYSEQLEQNA